MSGPNLTGKNRAVNNTEKVPVLMTFTIFISSSFAFPIILTSFALELDTFD